MAKKKLTIKQAAALRDSYLVKRQALLQAKVDDLGIILFDKIFNEYLSGLEQSGGKVISNGANISMVRGLDSVYKTFRDKYNAPVIKTFVEDIQGITPLNENYFAGIQSKPTFSAVKKSIQVVNKGLGITESGLPIKNGFVDKFIRDDVLLKKIKKQTVQGLTKGQGFNQLRNELKQTIQGEAGKPLSGGLQQYYRNYAYDTYQKVDRISSEVFADDLGLQYFIYTGGVIDNSRQLCIYCNGKVVNSAEFRHLEYGKLKKKYQGGLPHGKSGTWVPLEDLGGFGCIHRKNYIPTELALRMRDKWLNIKTLLL